MSIPLNTCGTRLVCFDFLAGCESGKLDMLAVRLVLEPAWLAVVEFLPEGLDNCFKAVAAAVASAKAWTQGPNVSDQGRFLAPYMPSCIASCKQWLNQLIIKIIPFNLQNCCRVQFFRDLCIE